MIKLGLDTESLHLWFQNKRMDIFGFIEKAHELGFDGVMINILKDYNLDPEWGTLMNNDPAHLKRVRDLLESYHMYAELATKGITKEHLLKVLDVAEALAADIIRTYIPITLNPLASRATGGEGKYDQAKVRGDFDPAVFDEAAMSLRQIIPELKKRRIRLALEKIAALEEIAPTEEELDAEFAKLAEQYKMDVEKVKAFIPAKELSKDLAVGKAMDMVKETAVVNG